MEFLSNVLSLFGVFLGLSVVVTIHEAGHFLAARWAGVEVEAFAIGWGKVLWSWKRGVTEFRICLLPLGGYCKMKGEQDLSAAFESQAQTITASPGSLFASPSWKRIVISAAGPLTNLILAFVLFFALSQTGLSQAGGPARIQLSNELGTGADLPAVKAGLVTGDKVTAVDGSPIVTFSQLRSRIEQSSGHPLSLTVDRNGTKIDIRVAASEDPASGRFILGIVELIDPVISQVGTRSAAALAGFLPGDRIVSVEGQPMVSQASFARSIQGEGIRKVAVQVERKGQTVNLFLVLERGVEAGIQFSAPFLVPTAPSPLEAAAEGYKATVKLLSAMVVGLGRVLTGQLNPMDNLSGPIGILQAGTEITNQAYSAGLLQGLDASVSFLAVISLALFLMNLLPIPALDGGNIIVSAIEGIRRRRLGLKALVRYQQVGVALILGLVLLTTFIDLPKLFRAVFPG